MLPRVSSCCIRFVRLTAEPAFFYRSRSLCLSSAKRHGTVNVRTGSRFSQCQAFAAYANAYTKEFTGFILKGWLAMRACRF